MGRGVGHDLRTVQKPALGDQLPGGQIWADPHFSIAVRTSIGGGVGSVWCRSLGRFERDSKELPREGEPGRAMRVGQISKLPDADEPSRQNVLGETAEELVRRKGHLPLLVAMSVVLPAEGHVLAIEGQQAVIADRHTMRISPEIVKHLSGSAKCGLRVHNPVLLEERIDKSGQMLWILQFGDRPRKDEFSLLVGHSHPFYEPGAKDGTEYVHRQEEGVFRMNPVFMVRGESACWNQAVDMRMQEQVLSPGMQDADEPDLRTKSFGLGRDLKHGRCTGSK